MNEAIVAGAIAGAIAGAMAGLAVLLASHGLPRRTSERAIFTRPAGGGWQIRTHRSQFTSTRVASLSLDAFDDSAKRVLSAAQDEAIRMDHNYIGTEHLLLGLVRGDADGPAGRALARLGVNLDKVRTAVQFIIGKGDAPVGPAEVTISPRAQKVLELAADEARRLGHARAGAAEILLGLVREGEGIASGVLESLGCTLDGIRMALMNEMGTGLRSPAPGTPPAQQTQVTRQTHAYRGPFDRFNDRAKRVLALAQDEAIRFNHNYIGPEHLLLALVREGEGVAARVLGNLGIPLSKLRSEVERVVGRGESTTSPSEITLIPRTKRVIELAIDESMKLGHHDVRTEHLLLGIVRDDGSMACAILKSQGVTLERVRHDVIAWLASPPDAPTAG